MTDDHTSSHAPELILLPGLDGTGNLFEPFVTAAAAAKAPSDVSTRILRYPTHEPLGYAQLLDLVIPQLPSDKKPWFLLAESFSSPLGVWIAERSPPGLRGLIICAGFVRSPMSTLLHIMPWPLLLRMPVPAILIRSLLIGDAPDQTLTLFKDSLRSVAPAVLNARIRAIIICDARPALRNCSLPTLYVRAQKDRLVTCRSWHEFRTCNPTSEYAEINARHLVLQQCPHEAWDVIADFIHRHT